MDNVSTQEREHGSVLAPKYDASGLISAVVADSSTKDVLVVAFMNEEALRKTIETGRVHFWSRSRQSLWMKGETSGNILKVVDILIDCDQDALVIYAEPHGPTCHTGEASCFYRKIEIGDDHAPTLRSISR